MTTKKTKWFKLGAVLLASLLLSACGNTGDNTEQTNLPQSTSTPAVTSTADTTSQDTAPEEPEFRGNEDYFSYAEQIPYENGDGITFEVLSNPYKIGDSYENLGVRVSAIDETLYIANYAGFLNIEKKINGEWVRLEVITGSHANGSADEVGRDRRYELLDKYNIFNMFDCQIIPELSAGEYRFVAYFQIGMTHPETRRYYIPFTVIE